MQDAFFETTDDEIFVPTGHTRGPWGPDSQHGGPPAALLGRAIQSLGDEMFVARIGYDILSPVRVAPLRLVTEVERPGKRVRLVRASLIDDDREVMRAFAWLLRTTELPLPVPAGPAPTPPETIEESPPFFTPYEGYLQAMEWRFAEGAFGEPGSAFAWIRMRHPLIPGEEITPLSRVLAAADSASGVSAKLDWEDWLFINVDLHVNLFRVPVGEWVGLEATTTIHSTGLGLASSTIFDRDGPIGRTEQTLFVDKRGN